MLAEANLTGAVLDRANLTGAMLYKANLTGADLRRCTGLTAKGALIRHLRLETTRRI